MLKSYIILKLQSTELLVQDTQTKDQSDIIMYILANHTLNG